MASAPVLVSLGRYNKNPQTRVLKRQTRISQSWRLGLIRGCQCGWVLSEGPLCLPLLTASSQGEGRALVSPCSYQGAGPSVGTHPHGLMKPSCLPKASPPNTITLELGLQHRDLGRT